MNQEAQTNVRTNSLPSPLELAHLSIALAQAGMMPRLEKPAERVRYSLKYLDACSKILEQERQILEAAEASIKRKAPIDKILSRFGDVENVPENTPLEAILKYCNAQRIKPSRNELQEIGEKRLWEQLSKAEQLSSVYLVLTNKVNPPRRDVVPLEMRRRWAANGLPYLAAMMAVEEILNAKKRRQSEKGKEGVKRRKPRAPKGDDGKYRSKELPPKSENGKFKKTLK
jgi:hypothetical protein